MAGPERIPPRAAASSLSDSGPGLLDASVLAHVSCKIEVKANADFDGLETSLSIPGLESAESGCASRAGTIWLSENDLPLIDTCTAEWLQERLAGLTPKDFQESVRIYATSSLLQAPESFSSVWHQYTTEQDPQVPLMTVQEAEQLDAVLMFCNPFEEPEINLLQNMLHRLDRIENVPPIFWVPHTNAVLANTDLCCPRFGMSEAALKDLLAMGIDGVVAGEPSGHCLALQLLSLFHRCRRQSQVMDGTVIEKRNRPAEAKKLRDLQELWLWDYILSRVGHSLPQVDDGIPADETKAVGGWEFGDLVGTGDAGVSAVYRLQRQAASAEEAESEAVNDAPQVMKMLSKKPLCKFSDVTRLNREVDILKTLSSQQWRHENILQFYQAYHSSTHFYFRLEEFGPMTLQQRLLARLAGHGKDVRPLAPLAALQLLSQAAAAVAHLHEGPRICHRDIKPENFLISEEDPRAPVLKLKDFDLAVKQPPGAVCKSVCGTVPFTAPEVYLAANYDGLQCDVWSLGVVTAEVQCGSRILERSLGVPMALPEPVAESHKKLAQQTVAALCSKDGVRVVKLFADYTYLGLRSIVGVTAESAANMLRRDPKERWPARASADFLKAAAMKARRQRFHEDGTQRPLTPSQIACH